MRILMTGATGTIGRATVRALIAQGHHVVCCVRNREAATSALSSGAEVRVVDLLDPSSVARDGVRGEPFGAVVSTLASRTGLPRDAWAVDYGAHANVLRVAQDAGIERMVLLSAICVQKPLLAFQNAKLAFEQDLIASGLMYSIVRPTAFFKSLSGQINRIKAGKPYLMFGDGRLTACKPISDDDLAAYLVCCLSDATKANRILPIGGPGPAITPREQGEMIFSALQRKPAFKSVPLGLLQAVQTILAAAGRFNRTLADKAEFAKIGLYYARESMLVLDPVSGRYDANATPSTGSETLADYYARVIRGEVADDRGDHAVF
jgi:divinyl chlorophyllide a 8-vinyl-reductase